MSGNAGASPSMNNERLAVAAHLHILLRRKLGRVTDVEWMSQNDDYAHEVVRLSLAQADAPELVAMAQRLLALLPPPRPVLPAGGAGAGRVAAPEPPRYVRSLR